MKIERARQSIPVRFTRRGYTMMHMLAYISMIAVFMLAASRLFVMTQKSFRQSQQSLTDVHQSQAMLRALERDAWAAKELAPLEEGAARLTLDADVQVDWRFVEGAVERQTGTDEIQRFEIGAEAAFSVEGPTLVLRGETG